MYIKYLLLDTTNLSYIGISPSKAAFNLQILLEKSVQTCVLVNLKIIFV